MTTRFGISFAPFAAVGIVAGAFATVVAADAVFAAAAILLGGMIYIVAAADRESAK